MHRSLWDIGTFPCHKEWNKIKTEIKLEPGNISIVYGTDRSRNIKNALAGSGRQVERKPKAHKFIHKRGTSRKGGKSMLPWVTANQK